MADEAGTGWVSATLRTVGQVVPTRPVPADQALGDTPAAALLRWNQDEP